MLLLKSPSKNRADCFPWGQSLSDDISPFFLRFVALALECYACTNVPGFGGSKCDSDSIEKITCPPFANRCFTIKYSMNIGDTSVDLMMRNCTNSMACDPKSDLYSKYRNLQAFYNRS